MPPAIVDNPVFGEEDEVNFGDDGILDDEPEAEEPLGTAVNLGEAENDEDDDILNNPIVGDIGVDAGSSAAPAADLRQATPASAISKTPAKAATGRKAKTPRTAASTSKAAAPASSAKANTAKKRKTAADENGETPVPKKARVSRPARGPTRVLTERKAASVAKADIQQQSQKRARAPNGTAEPVKKAKAKGTRGRKPRAAPAESEEPADAYEVEAIVDSGIDIDTKEHLFFVKWKGYPDSDNTWEPLKNLTHCPDLIRAHKKSQEKATAAPRKRAAKKKPAATKKAPAVEPKKAVAPKRKAPTPRGRPVGTRPSRRSMGGIQ